MTPLELEEVLLARPLDVIAKDFILDGLPFVFQQDPGLVTLLNQHLSSYLNVAERDIVVVGSAETGFSLSPDKFPRLFNEESDIDVAIVDAELYDMAWMTILKWHYPRRYTSLPPPDLKWMRYRMKDLYWGWFTPASIGFYGLTFPKTLAPLRDMRTTWFNAFQSLSQYQDFADRKISGRLYRTWGHATEYHVEGLRQLKSKVQRFRQDRIR